MIGLAESSKGQVSQSNLRLRILTFRRVQTGCETFHYDQQKQIKFHSEIERNVKIEIIF